MTKKENKIRSLELLVKEQRRDYDMVNSMYETARAKNYTFIAVILGLLTFLYTTNLPTPEKGQEISIKQRLFIPNEAYGIVIYAVAVLLILFAMRSLVMALQARPWKTAYDDDHEDKTNDYIQYLEHVKKCYDICSETNSKSYKDKVSLVDGSLWPLLIGGILLVVLKTLGG